jgi:MGT family glycosyltransferase
MGRIVYFSFLGRGHINPTLPVMRELVHRGEQVFYFGMQRFRPAIEETGAQFRSYASEIAAQDHGPGPFARVSSTLETLVEFSRVILDQHLAQVRVLCPTHIMFDSFAPWGSFVAERLGLPSIAFVPTILINSEIDARYGKGQAEDPQLTPEWYASIRCRSEALPTAPRPEQLLQSYGDFNIVNTSRLFQPMAKAFDERRFEFVGPCFDPEIVSRDQLDDQPLVLISLGTVYGDPDFLRRCTDQLKGGPWQVVTLDGAQTQASQIALLRRCAVFVTHGGMNSVHEALYYGVPLVLAPQAADHFWISARVVELGAGVALDRVRECVEEVLSNAHYARAAERIGASLRAAGGWDRAADVIQSFMTRSTSKPMLSSESIAPVMRPGV